MTSRPVLGIDTDGEPKQLRAADGDTAGLPAFTVANLPASGNRVGDLAYATNGRAMVSVLNILSISLSLQAVGSGTGCLVTWSGSAWQIAGTTMTVSA